MSEAGLVRVEIIEGDVVERRVNLDTLVKGWLEQKAGRTGSVRTYDAYGDLLAGFRAFLQARGADLDSDTALLAPAAEKWAASSEHGRTVAASTYNMRLAVLSSFFTYWQRTDQAHEVPNPIARCARRPVQAYASATALSPAQLAGLHQIDRSTAAGMRDYTLLLVALSTGRRASELAALCKERVNGEPVLRVEGRRMTLLFKHCKGGKRMYDLLIPEAATAVLAWVKLYYGSFEAMPEGAPLWPALGRNPKGRQVPGRVPAQPGISIQAIADICQKYLGTSKVHSTRHTFAHKMNEAGAQVTEISAKLGHEDLRTTQRYLARLKSDENPYGDKLARLLGL